MTTATPSHVDFQTQVRRFLDEGAADLPANWPLEAVLQAAAGPGFSRAEISPYAGLLQEALVQVLEALCAGEANWLSKADTVFLVGPVAEGTAGPYRPVIARAALPPETNRLIGLIYDWLFTFLGKSSELNGTRFLDDDLAAPIEVRLYFADPEGISAEEIAGQIRAALVDRLNFSPPLVCRVKATGSFSTRTALTGRCLHGWELVETRLRESWGTMPEPELQIRFQNAVAITRRASRHDGDVLPADQAAIDHRIVAHYRRVKYGENPSVSLDLLADVREKSGSWYDKNREFFRHVLAGQYDRLLVEDATKGLDDSKGAEKENRYTISRVRGLEIAGQFVPAVDMVVKLRGFSHYRGDINNWLDLLKEYMSYTLIHRQAPGGAGYLLAIGPLLLTCEGLDVPFDRAEKSRWIGFFMEALSPPAEGRVFTCRVRYVTDFWAPGEAIGRVLRAAQREGVAVDERSLRMQLRNLALRLWKHGLSINYCDLVLTLGYGGRVESVRIIDLERLSFSELAGEDHLILDTLVDIKTHLRKEPWVHVLVNLFRSREDPEGFPSLKALQSYLNPRSRGRRRRLGFWRGMRRALLGFGSRRGAKVWRRVIALRARLSDLISRIQFL